MLQIKENYNNLWLRGYYDFTIWRMQWIKAHPIKYRSMNMMKSLRKKIQKEKIGKKKVLSCYQKGKKKRKKEKKKHVWRKHKRKIISFYFAIFSIVRDGKQRLYERQWTTQEHSGTDWREAMQVSQEVWDGYRERRFYGACGEWWIRSSSQQKALKKEKEKKSWIFIMYIYSNAF